MRIEFSPWSKTSGGREMAKVNVWNDQGREFNFILVRSLVHEDMKQPTLLGDNEEVPFNGWERMRELRSEEARQEVQCAINNGAADGWVWLTSKGTVPMYEDEKEAYMFAAERVADFISAEK